MASKLSITSMSEWGSLPATPATTCSAATLCNSGSQAELSRLGLSTPGPALEARG